MSKNKKKGTTAAGKKGTVEMDPSVIRFTHARIRPFFTGCGKKIDETIAEIVEGRTSIYDLPLITVIENDGEFFSLNNRRLYTIKHIQSLGLLKDNKIAVYIKPALEREKKRYNPARCALQAKVMLEHEKPSEQDEDDDSDASEGKEGDKQSDGIDIEKLSLKSESVSVELPAGGATAATDDVKEPRDQRDKGKAKNRASKSSPDELPGPSIAPKPTNVTISLPVEVSKELKDLAKLVAKGKRKAVQSQIDEWEMAGIINDAQREAVLRLLNL